MVSSMYFIPSYQGQDEKYRVTPQSETRVIILARSIRTTSCNEMATYFLIEKIPIIRHRLQFITIHPSYSSFRSCFVFRQAAKAAKGAISFTSSHDSINLNEPINSYLQSSINQFHLTPLKSSNMYNVTSPDYPTPCTTTTDQATPLVTNFDLKSM